MCVCAGSVRARQRAWHGVWRVMPIFYVLAYTVDIVVIHRGGARERDIPHTACTHTHIELIHARLMDAMTMQQINAFAPVEPC